jgi:ABC-2 type transport system ATP-binding protein
MVGPRILELLMTHAGADRPLLEARNLVKTFGDLTAVGGIDLQVAPGECLALLGPNGAGKTTTVEMLEGLVRPTSGSISIFGKNLAQERSAIMERIGVLLQETNLYKRYTVRETLDLFGSFYQKSGDPQEIIDLLNLSDKTGVQLKNLSGGQKQRVYLGACLINNPELIFLDEPTTGLDPQSRRSIWDLLLGLKSKRCSMLLTTHYMEEAERLADRVAIIDHGKIIAEGSVEGLISQHSGDKVVSFILAKDQTPLTGRDLRAQVDNLARDNRVFAGAVCSETHCDIVTESAGPTITAIMDALRQTSLSLPELNMRAGSLEDVFIKLTGRSIRDE